MFSVLPPNSTCLLIMPTFLMPLYIVNYYPGTCTMETSAFHLHWVTKRILDTFIVSSSHFRACRQPYVRSIRRWALFWGKKAAKPWVSKRVCGESSLTATRFNSMCNQWFRNCLRQSASPWRFPKASFGGIRGHIWRPLKTLSCRWNCLWPRRRHTKILFLAPC